MEATATDKPTQEHFPAVIRFLNVIDNVGNRLPHPFWLLGILAGILSVLSLVRSPVLGVIVG